MHAIPFLIYQVLGIIYMMPATISKVSQAGGEQRAPQLLVAANMLGFVPHRQPAA